MPRSGQKTSLAELLLWDVVLAGVAAFFLFLNARLDEAPVTPPPQSSPAPASTQAPDEPPEQPAASPAGPGPARVSAVAQELEQLRAEAAKLSPPEALAHYKRASAKLRASQAWRRFWPGEEARLNEAARGSALTHCLVRDLQVAADFGRVERTLELLELLPSAARQAHEGEGAWARTQAARKPDTSLALDGYSPGRAESKGKRVTLVCWRGQAEANTLRGVAEGALVRLEELAGRELSATLQLAVLASPASKPPSSARVVSLARTQDTAETLAERVAWLAADWGARQLFPGPERWTRAALVRVLASSQGGRGLGAPNALGRAYQALCSPPDGTGKTLRALAASGPSSLRDPAQASAVSFVRFAVAERSGPAIELWPALVADARGSGKLSSWLTPARAAGLEAAWKAAH